jgi:hypothetical protein
VRDESTDKEPVRMILEPKSKNQDVQEMMNILLANTSLETNVSLNFTMLGRDGRPQQKNLVQIVSSGSPSASTPSSGAAATAWPRSSAASTSSTAA